MVDDKRVGVIGENTPRRHIGRPKREFVTADKGRGVCVCVCIKSVRVNRHIRRFIHGNDNVDAYRVYRVCSRVRRRRRGAAVCFYFYETKEFDIARTDKEQRLLCA